MPRGGARKGAGRKPKPLAEKIATGNPGRRPLKKVQFEGESKQDSAPPEILSILQKKYPIASPAEIYGEMVEYLTPSGCMNLIPKALIADYVMAKYYLSCAQNSNFTCNFLQISACKKHKCNFLQAFIWEIISKIAT